MRRTRHDDRLDPLSAPTTTPPPGTPDWLLPLARQLLDGLNDVRTLLSGARKELYTVEEIAQLTGRTQYTIRRWIKENRITASRVNGTGPRGRLLVARDQLQRLVALGSGAGVPAVAGD